MGTADKMGRAGCPGGVWMEKGHFACGSHLKDLHFLGLCWRNSGLGVEVSPTASQADLRRTKAPELGAGCPSHL